MKRENAIFLIAKHKIKTLTKEERNFYLLNWWVTEEDEDYKSLPKFIKDDIPQSLKKEIEQKSKFENPLLKKYDPIIILGIYFDFRGVKNEYLESILKKINKENISVEGKVENLERCPCCGYKTLDQKCDWDICKVCFWEDDCTSELNKFSGPNRLTLQEGKDNFLKFGASKMRSLEFTNKDEKLKYIQ